jgi:hypothetical protein
MADEVPKLLQEQYDIDALRHNQPEIKRHLQPAGTKNESTEELKVGTVGRRQLWLCHCRGLVPKGLREREGGLVSVA